MDTRGGTGQPAVHAPMEDPTHDPVIPDPRDGDWGRLKASVRGALFGRKPAPATIGRFTVLKELGRGGMGIVYSAYDDELERKVAIKLLDAEHEAGSEGRARLLREAQAMARLSHPNVIPVFEVGTHDGDVFIAMEYVRGQTLRGWLAQAPRAHREILEVFAQAGAGLAAAHAAGLVHRDFKPDNVLVGPQGRARVVDFGLARPPQDEHQDDSEAETTGSPPEFTVTQKTGGLLDSPLTRDGAVVGTPAYMAPEQHVVEATDARSDQFSFCVALYEALYGERPYGGETLHDLGLAVARGTRRPEPASARVPTWIRDIVVRGLSVNPADRHPDMAALLAALRRDPAIKRRRGLVAAAGVLAVVGSLGGGVWLGGASPGIRECQPVAEKVAGVWDDSRRESLRRAFTTSGMTGSDRSWQEIQSRLDGFLSGWMETYHQVCGPTGELGPGETTALEARRTCLDWRIDDLDRSLGLLLQAGSDTLAAGGDLIRLLPSPSLCGDARNVAGLIAPAKDEASRQETLAILAGLARARVAMRGERMEKSRAEARAAVERARALEDRALEGRALLVLQRAEHHMGANAAAVETVREAALAAETSGADRLYVMAALAAVEALTLGEYRVTEAEQWMKRAEAMREQLGPDPALDHEMAYVRGTFALMRDDGEQALVELQRALDLGEKVHGRMSIELLRTLNNYAVALRFKDDMETATHLLERQREIVEAEFGQESVHTAFALMNLGSTRMMLGEVDAAMALGQEAVSIMDRVVAVDNPRLALAHLVYGSSLEQAGRMSEALAEYEIAVAVVDKAGFDIQAVRSYFSLQRVLHDFGRFEDALAVGRRARQVFERQFSGIELAKDRQYAHLLGMMALEAVLAGQPEEGRTLARRAIELHEQRGAPSAASNLPRYALLRAMDRAGEPVTALLAQIQEAADAPHHDSPSEMMPSGKRITDEMRAWLERRYRGSSR